MADVTNPAAIAFVNNLARPYCDNGATLYYASKALVDAWYAGNLSAIIPNDSSVILDGAATDGRIPVTGADITSVITRALEVISLWEAGGNAKLNQILKPHVNVR